MVLGKYERAASDCAEGLKRDGQLMKVRLRQVTALTHLGKLDRAADVSQQGLGLGGGDDAALVASLARVNELRAAVQIGTAALEEGDYSKALYASAGIRPDHG